MKELELFPIRLRKVLDEANIDDKILERALTLPKDAVYNWTHGVTKSWPKYARAISDYLNVSYMYLIGETDNPNKNPDTGGDGASEDVVIQFLHSLPHERLRGILLALGAPEEVLAALDQQEPNE